MKRTAVYYEKAKVETPPNVTAQHWENLNAAVDWWSLIPSWDSETHEINGFKLVIKVGMHHCDVYGRHLLEAIERALEVSLKL